MGEPPTGGRGGGAACACACAEARLGAAQHAAKLKKLGPLAHVPGGADLDLSAPLPENVDIDTLEEKPWRNAGADLTDYFNYGFTEDTWRLYCARQLEIRRDREPAAAGDRRIRERAGRPAAGVSARRAPPRPAAPLPRPTAARRLRRRTMQQQQQQFAQQMQAQQMQAMQMQAMQAQARQHAQRQQWQDDDALTLTGAGDDAGGGGGGEDGAGRGNEQVAREAVRAAMQGRRR